MSDGTKWDDAELMDTKDIFIKMMDFIRNYDPGTEEYTRRIRFTTHEALNDLAKRMLEVGDLKFYDPKPKNDRDDDMPIRSTGLSRSKSDHRCGSSDTFTNLEFYLAHVIEQSIFRSQNLEYLQRNFVYLLDQQ